VAAGTRLLRRMPMAFFDLPADETLPPEALRILKEQRKLLGIERIVPTWQTYGRLPGILEARLVTALRLSEECPFPAHARNVASMLIAHARKCRTCFGASRRRLAELGVDEVAMDSMCANPGALPLPERDRLFVQFALKVAAGASDLTRADFDQMAAHGFTEDEVKQIIGFATFWVMNTMFSASALVALADE
jgi:alkylhydroperoxidase family enzyme